MLFLGNDIYEKSSKQIKIQSYKEVLNKSFRKKKYIWYLLWSTDYCKNLWFENNQINNKKRVHYVYFHKLKKKLKLIHFIKYEIKTLNKNFENLAVNDEGYIEAFSSKEFNFLCVMWHPERYKI